MTAQRPESAADAGWFCGVPYPSAEAAVAARTAMAGAPKGLRVKLCGGHWHLRARGNRTGEFRGRGLRRLPAGPESRVATTAQTRGIRASGKGGRPALARWGRRGWVSADVKNGSEGRRDG